MNDGGPAFPNEAKGLAEYKGNHPGMSLRDILPRVPVTL